MLPSLPPRWVSEFCAKATHVLRSEHICYSVLLEDGASDSPALQTAGAQQPAACEQSPADCQEALYPQQEMSDPAQNYHVEREVRNCLLLLPFCRGSRGCMLVYVSKWWVCDVKIHKYSKAFWVPQVLLSKQQHLFTFFRTLFSQSIVIPPQLGIKLITMYKCFDIQPRFHWSELQCHTWWLGCTAKISFISRKSKSLSCEIKLCSVLKLYAKFGRFSCQLTSLYCGHEKKKMFSMSWHPYLFFCIFLKRKRRKKDIRLHICRLIWKGIEFKLV